MGNEVQIIIKAIDKASGELKKVGGSLGALKEVGKTVAMAMGGVTAAVGAAAVAYKAVIAPIINYNKSILDAARSTRMGTEDLSRFIQVGDDVGVSMDSITRALQMATKNGFAPSISAIADLADKANAMKTPTERAAMLAKMFGRNWAELDPILQLGGQRIREMSNAQADGLVVTEAEIKKTEELRLALDELGDSFTAAKNTVGLWAAEIINLDTRAIDLLNQRLRETGEYGKVGFLQWYLEFRRLRDMLAEGEERKRIFDIRDAILTLPPAAKTAGEAIKSAFEAATEASVAAYLQDLEYKAGVDDIAAAIAALRDRHVVINVTTVTEEITAQTWKWREQLNQQGPGGPQMAGGADFVVPPGYPNDSFPMRVQSGEHVQVTPAGEKSKSNVTINVSSTPMDVQWITRQLKAAVGM